MRNVNVKWMKREEKWRGKSNVNEKFVRESRNWKKNEGKEKE